VDFQAHQEDDRYLFDEEKGECQQNGRLKKPRSKKRSRLKWRYADPRTIFGRFEYIDQNILRLRLAGPDRFAEIFLERNTPWREYGPGTECNVAVRSTIDPDTGKLILYFSDSVFFL